MSALSPRDITINNLRTEIEDLQERTLRSRLSLGGPDEGFTTWDSIEDNERELIDLETQLDNLLNDGNGA